MLADFFNRKFLVSKIINEIIKFDYSERDIFFYLVLIKSCLMRQENVISHKISQGIEGNFLTVM